MTKIYLIGFVIVLVSMTSLTESFVHNLAHLAGDPPSEKRNFQTKCKFDSRVTDLKILNVQLNKKIVDMDKNNEDTINELNNEIQSLKKELTQLKNENKLLVDENDSLKSMNNDNGLVGPPVSLKPADELRHEMDDDSKLRSQSMEDTAEHRSLKLKVTDLEHEKQELMEDYEHSLMKLQHDKDMLESRVQILQNECEKNKDIFTKMSMQITEGFMSVNNKIDKVQENVYIIDTNKTPCNCSALPDNIMHYHNATNITFLSENGEVQHLTAVKLTNSAQELDDPNVRFFSRLEKGLKVGQQIDIYGKVPAFLPTKNIGINFWQCIGNKRTHSIFHFNPRFDNTGGEVVRNALLQYGWETDEREAPEFPFVPGKEFHLIILCEAKQFRVLIDDKEYITFAYRADISAVNAIDITLDVYVNEVVYTS